MECKFVPGSADNEMALRFDESLSNVQSVFANHVQTQQNQIAHQHQNVQLPVQINQRGHERERETERINRLQAENQSRPPYIHRPCAQGIRSRKTQDAPDHFQSISQNPKSPFMVKSNNTSNIGSKSSSLTSYVQYSDQEVNHNNGGQQQNLQQNVQQNLQQSVPQSVTNGTQTQTHNQEEQKFPNRRPPEGKKQTHSLQKSFSGGSIQNNSKNLNEVSDLPQVQNNNYNNSNNSATASQLNQNNVNQNNQNQNISIKGAGHSSFSPTSRMINRPNILQTYKNSSSVFGQNHQNNSSAFKKVQTQANALNGHEKMSPKDDVQGLGQGPVENDHQHFHNHGHDDLSVPEAPHPGNLIRKHSLPNSNKPSKMMRLSDNLIEECIDKVLDKNIAAAQNQKLSFRSLNTNNQNAPKITRANAQSMTQTVCQTQESQDLNLNPSVPKENQPGPGPIRNNTSPDVDSPNFTMTCMFKSQDKSTIYTLVCKLCNQNDPYTRINHDKAKLISAYKMHRTKVHKDYREKDCIQSCSQTNAISHADQNKNENKAQKSDRLLKKQASSIAASAMNIELSSDNETEYDLRFLEQNATDENGEPKSDLVGNLEKIKVSLG